MNLIYLSIPLVTRHRNIFHWN